MEVVFNLVNLKSGITFIHLAGLAFGLGGAWILDTYLLKKFSTKLSNEEFVVIEFVSKLVLIGLFFLWVSGLFFLGYYYMYTPELLLNEKVWAKVVIVSILTMNGFLVHAVVLDKLKSVIGKTIFEALSTRELRSLATIGAISFVSWLFPVVLGVSKSLNFTASATSILLVYAVVILVSILTSTLTFSYYRKRVLSRSRLDMPIIANEAKQSYVWTPTNTKEEKSKHKTIKDQLEKAV